MTCPTLEDCQAAQADADAKAAQANNLSGLYDVAYALQIEAELIAAQCWEDYLNCEPEGEALQAPGPGPAPNLEYVQWQIKRLQAELKQCSKNITEQQRADFAKFQEMIGK